MNKDYRTIRTRDPATQGIVWQVWSPADILIYERTGSDCERIAKEVTRLLRRGWSKDAAVKHALA